MNNQEIDNLMRNYLPSANWGGIYPSDKIPISICRRCNYGIICNTQNSNQKGEHWIAIYLPKSGIAEYFDSFGGPPNVEEFSSFLENGEFVYHTQQIQSAKGITCGHHCVFFLFCRFIGIEYHTIISFYEKDMSINDHFVFEFVNKMKKKNVKKK